jgi:ubiquinone/menaquinone biosynthesis C-methylase UbiE
MPDFSKRSSEVEIMDDLQCAGQVVDQTLIELEFINKWLGGNAVTIRGFNFLLSASKTHEPNKALVVADIGCGGGDMLQILSSECKRRKQQAEFIGIDANPNILAFAVKNSHGFPEIKFHRVDILSAEFREKHFDIIVATLFFHHFSDDQLMEIFSYLKKQARVGIIINDLHRHWFAYYAIKLLTAMFSKSAMVKFDAPLSVLKGFKRKELEEILSKAGIVHYTLKWKWAFRWQLVISTP